MSFHRAFADYLLREGRLPPPLLACSQSACPSPGANRPQLPGPHPLLSLSLSPFLWTQHEGALASVARIGVHRLGSPLWASTAESTLTAQDCCRALLRLRAVLRRSCAVAFVTLPRHLLPNSEEDTALIERWYVCDGVVLTNPQSQTVFL